MGINQNKKALNESLKALPLLLVIPRGYGDKARFMLSKLPSTRGHIIEVFLGTQFYFNCQGVVETASRLYTHSTGETFKRGSTSRVRPGNIERYLKYLNQIDLTYDLFSIKQEVLWQMLPPEFESFKND